MVPEARSTPPLPVTVLTGFLGSGKTTLLNQLLSSPALADAAVLVNEYGEIGLDHLLVRHAREDLVLLASGCVCCSLRADLVEQLGDLLARRDRGELPPFARVLIETTGLADPAPIVQTLMTDPVLSERLYLDGVVVTVDAQHARSTLAKHLESRKQLAVADRVVLTKIDLVSEGEREAVEALVRELNPVVQMRGARMGEVEAAFVLRVGHLDTRGIAKQRGRERERVDGQEDAHAHAHEDEDVNDHDHDHDHDEEGRHGRVKALSVTLGEPVDFRSFSLWVAMLTQLNGERIVRLKAVVSARGEPTPVAVQAVQHVVYPPLNLPSMPELGGKSHLVVLTVDMSDAELQELRESLLALP